jgi:hypothetical protein
MFLPTGNEQRSPSTTALLVLLTAVTVIPFAFAPLHLDGMRDLVAAWDIISGARLPLAGPVINESVHLGPVWFYILAIPLAISHSLTITLLFVGVLAGLKFWLAEAIGRQAVGARFGLLFAAALAMPGWSLLTPIIFTHTALIETSMLAVAYCLLRLAQGGSPRWWLSFGILQALALHTHPVTVLLLVLLPPVCWMRFARGDCELAREMRWLGLGIVAGLLPFLPSLLFEAERNWKGFEQLGRFASGHAPIAEVLAAPSLWYGIAIRGPDMLFSHLASPVAGEFARWLWIALLLAALLGCIRAARLVSTRRNLLVTLLVICISLLLLAALRDRTTYYMALAWIPFWSVLITLGWWSLVRKSAGLVMVGAATLCTFGSVSVVQRMEQGFVQLPIMSVHDVRLVSPTFGLPVIPAWRIERFGRDVCTKPVPVVLHGPLGQSYDSVLGLPGRMACGDTPWVTVGGGAAEAGAVHLLGLTPAQLRGLGWQDAGWAEAFSLAPSRIIAASSTSVLADGSVYPFRTRQASVPPIQKFTFEAAHSELIMSSNLFGAYEASEVVTIDANGHQPRQLMQDSVSTVWRCSACDPEPVRWELEVRSRSAVVDLLVFEPLPPEPR